MRKNKINTQNLHVGPTTLFCYGKYVHSRTTELSPIHIQVKGWDIHTSRREITKKYAEFLFYHSTSLLSGNPRKFILLQFEFQLQQVVMEGQ